MGCESNIFYKKDDGRIKEIRSEHYNSRFDRKTGLFHRWGKELADNPNYCVMGPELIDIEIVQGKCSGNCPFCYKNNGENLENKYMNFYQFKQLFEILPESVNQIAFGITDIDLNPDFWKIMKYSRDKGVIPNYTCNGKLVNKDIGKKSAEICGAVAVSLYDKDECYNAVKIFSDAGVTQVNIHYMLAEETLDAAFTVIDDIAEDSRLTKLFGLIFLQYKPHGRGIGNFTPIINLAKFNRLLIHAEKKKVSFGFDSCTTPIYLKSIERDRSFDKKVEFVEPCESGLFSYYCNTEGEFFPCSFMEGEKGWEKGINSVGIEKFDDIWHHERIVAWRDKLINSSSSCNCDMSGYCRSCPHYTSISACKLYKLEVIS